MCFIKRGLSKHIKPLKAKKNIKVYKVLETEDYGPFFTLKIEGKIYPYEKGWIYYITKNPFQFIGNHIDGNCFHSMINLNKALIRAKNFLDCKVVEMIIPKGALYYKNDTEYVSDQLYYPKNSKTYK